MNKSFVVTTMIKYEKDNKHLELNKRIREDRPLGELQYLYTRMRESLRVAPKTRGNTLFYRGISAKINVKPGETLSMLGFIWCSRNEEIARRFTADTSGFYNGTGNTIWKTKQGNGTLFVVRAGKGVSYIERNVYIPKKKMIWNEVILGVVFKVIEVHPASDLEPDVIIVEAAPYY